MNRKHNLLLSPCLLLALVPACAPPAASIPAVDYIMHTWPRGPRPDHTTLANGRNIYLTDCARCHSPLPVRKYDARAWNKLLPRMIHQAGLNASEEEALRAYIEAALVVPPPP